MSNQHTESAKTAARDDLSSSSAAAEGGMRGSTSSAPAEPKAAEEKKDSGASAPVPASPGSAVSVLRFWWKALRFMVLLFLSTATIAFGVVAGITVYRTYFAVPEEIEVPVIQGKDLHEANRMLNSMGLRLRLEEGKYSNKFPEEIVISQEPAPGKTVRQEREVLAVVSLGPELMTVPDLNGKSLRDVDIILAENKLTMGSVKEVEKEGVKTIQVVSQKPKAGSKVRRGTPINIEVNKGASVAGVVVPDWSGKNVATAKALIAKVGLRLGRISWSPSTAVQQGFVIKQNPPYGAEVALGSEVELEISAGAASDRMLVQRQLDLVLPKGSRYHEVRVVLVSGAGEEEVYHARQVVGDHLYLWVSGSAGSDVEVYINGNMVKRDRL
ncbi:PASTA domain-containing protein [bacterium]|nr:PASTA domain-containing protein [bacterium]